MANDPDRCVAFDTEFNNRKEPFIATTCDWQLQTELYNCHKPKEVAKLRQLLEDPTITKIAFPYTVDAHVVKHLNIRCRGPFEDPLIAGTLLDENFASRKGLKPMAKKYLKADIKEAKKLSKYKAKYKKKAKKLGIEFDYSQIPRFVMKPYATEDAVFTQKLWFLFREPIKRFQRIYETEKKVARVILKMQAIGMMVDRKFARQQAARYGKEAETCYADIQAVLKQNGIKLPEFNPSSPKQVAYVMKKMGVPLPENERGHPITEAKVLAQYDSHKIVALQLLYRFLTKQKGTYFDPLWRRYTTKEFPYAHFFTFGSGARTGRMSAELIQTIPRPDESRTAKAPKLARMAFRPRPGYFMLAVDYKALQMMIFFHFANATTLIQKCRDGWDPHDAACMMLFGVVEKELRKDTKNIQFGLVFGMGLNKLLRSLQNSKAKADMSRLEASQILEKYYSIVPVKEFTRECISQLHRTGILELKFESPLMEFNREYRVPQELAYKGPNVLIQGTEAYVMKYAMLRVSRMISQKGMDVNLLAQVHDELLFEVSEKEPAHRVVKEICGAMEDHVSLKIPLRVEPKVSKKNWGSVEEWKKVKHEYPRRLQVAV